MAKIALKNPPTSMTRVFGPETPPSSPAPSSPPDGNDESGETYHLSAAQLATLNSTGTVKCDEGCTITADVAGETP